jgi:hypothetical protein
MKKLKAIAIGALLTVSYLHAGAQEKIPLNEPDYNKPKLFADLPQKINLKIVDMESLFSAATGSSVSARLTDHFIFQGVVVSKSDDKDVTVRSVIVRSTNRLGAVFTFTKITGEDGSIVYRGRIISPRNSDAFELVNDKGQYVLQKTNYYDLVNE